MRISGEQPYSFFVELEGSRESDAEFRGAFVEQGGLSVLDVLLGSAEVSGDIGDKVFAVGRAKYLGVQERGLLEVDVFARSGVLRDDRIDINHGRSYGGDGFRSSHGIWVVIGFAPAIPINGGGSVALVGVAARSARGINGKLGMVRPKSPPLGVAVREEPAL